MFPKNYGGFLEIIKKFPVGRTQAGNTYTVGRTPCCRVATLLTSSKSNLIISIKNQKLPLLK